MAASSTPIFCVAVVLLLTGCATQGRPVIGQGPYRYAFVLKDPATGRPAADRPYALYLKRGRLPFVMEKKGVYQGLTDARGRTAIFRLPFPARPTDWRLVERFGGGPLGEQFVMTNGSSDKGVARFPYTLVTCTDPPRRFHGVSDRNGLTAYAATAAPTDIQLFGGDEPDAVCQKDDGPKLEIGPDKLPDEPSDPPGHAPEAP